MRFQYLAYAQTQFNRTQSETVLPGRIFSRESRYHHSSRVLFHFLLSYNPVGYYRRSDHWKLLVRCIYILYIFNQRLPLRDVTDDHSRHTHCSRGHDSWDKFQMDNDDSSPKTYRTIYARYVLYTACTVPFL